MACAIRIASRHNERATVARRRLLPRSVFGGVCEDAAFRRPRAWAAYAAMLANAAARQLDGGGENDDVMKEMVASAEATALLRPPLEVDSDDDDSTSSSDGERSDYFSEVGDVNAIGRGRDMTRRMTRIAVVWRVRVVHGGGCRAATKESHALRE